MKKKLNLSIIILGISLLSSTAQIYPVRPQLSDKHSFSMILLPDPQSYNKFDANQPLFELQTAWIANSIEPLNIKGTERDTDSRRHKRKSDKRRTMAGRIQGI